MSVTELERLALERGMTLREIADVLRALPHVTRSQLTGAEADVLRSLGVDPREAKRGPQLLGVLHRRRLVESSLRVSEVAELLARDTSRIRQRLGGRDRSLLGFRRRSGQREWLLPRFQFALGLHDLDSWGRLLQALPPADETSPVALVEWLVAAKPHLGGRSRAQALAEGYDADALVAEAATFGVPV